MCPDVGSRIELLHCLSGNGSFALSHVPLAEQKLSVQVAGFNGIQINLQNQMLSDW